jgi:hypothetical protein
VCKGILVRFGREVTNDILMGKLEDGELVEIDVLREMKREQIVTRERVPEASTAM